MNSLVKLGVAGTIVVFVVVGIFIMRGGGPDRSVAVVASPAVSSASTLPPSTPIPASQPPSPIRLFLS